MVFFEVVFGESLVVLFGEKELEVDFLLLDLDESLVDLGDGWFELLDDDVFLDHLLTDFVFLFLVLGDFLYVGQGLLVFLLVNDKKLLEVGPLLELLLKLVYFRVQLLDLIFVLFLFPEKPVLKWLYNLMWSPLGALETKRILNPKIRRILIKLCLIRLLVGFIDKRGGSWDVDIMKEWISHV